MTERFRFGTPADLPRLTGTVWSPLFAKGVVVAIGATALVVLSAFFDARIAAAVPDLPPILLRYAGQVSDLGKSGYMFAASGLVALTCFGARRWLPSRQFDPALTVLMERALYVFATLAVSGIGAQVVKHLVGRARPKLMQALGPYHFDLLSMKASLASFPSGHAASVFSLAVALGLIAPRWRAPMLAFALVVSASRIVVEAHYVSDVAAGGALGVGSALLVARWLASRDYAFRREGASIVLKGRGWVNQALAGLTQATDRRPS